MARTFCLCRTTRRTLNGLNDDESAVNTKKCVLTLVLIPRPHGDLICHGLGSYGCCKEVNVMKSQLRASIQHSYVDFSCFW